MSSHESLPENVVKQLKSKNGNLEVRGLFSVALVQELLKEENAHVKSLHANDHEESFGESMKNLETLLEKSASITSLEVEGQDYKEALRCFLRGVGKSTALVTLRVRDVFGEQHASLLCGMLRQNKSLRELDLCWSKLGVGAADVVETALHEKRITQLDVGDNNVEHDATRRICAALKDNNACLRSITLHCSSFSKESIELLADLLRSDQVLEELDLSNCKFGDAWGVMIAEALQSNVVLKTISLSRNKMGQETCKMLGIMLLTNACLQSLVLSYNSLEREGCRVICEGMKNNHSLTKLDLSCCMLTKTDLDVVAGMLQTNQTLKVLFLFENVGQDDGVMVLAKSLAGHRSLDTLYWPDMTDEASKLCADILMEENGSLLDCGNMFDQLCTRNVRMHNVAREAVQTLRVLRWRDEEKHRNILHRLQKDVLKIIAELVWASRTQFGT